jgi:tetratricopeptide (TPR) repeat protein
MLADGRGDVALSESLYQEALEIARALEDRMLVATCWMNLGALADRAGDYAAARRHYEESLALRTASGDRMGIGTALHNLGSVLCSQEDYAAARARLSESLTLRREMGSRYGVLHTLESFAAVAIGSAGGAEGERSARRGTRLLGAAQALRLSHGAPLHDYQEAWKVRYERRARTLLGDTAYADEFAAGQAMTWDEAVACALEEGSA